MNVKELLSKIDTSFKSGGVDGNLFALLREKCTDSGYFEFLVEENGGFFFNRSLHLYGLTSRYSYHNLFEVNKSLEKYFGSSFSGLLAFGQDVLGNQFCFSSKGVLFFNIETTEVEILASDFDKWLKVLGSDLDYLTGETFSKRWGSKEGLLEYGYRLCPKMPFVIGGQYEVENFYSQPFPNYLDINANIANQIKNLPEGAQVKLKTIN